MDSLLLPVCLAVLSLTFTSCRRTVHVREKMTWECAPQEYNPAFYARPDEYVRFRFSENPKCFEVQTSKDFCPQLKDAGRSIVDVDFEIWGRGKNVQGYRMLAVDGHPIQ